MQRQEKRQEVVEINATEFFKNNFCAFVKAAFEIVVPANEYMHCLYIDLICAYLEECADRKCNRLVINIPPRHMKSTIVSVLFTAWLLARNPSEVIMVATYSKDLNLTHAKTFRDLLQSPWYRTLFPSVVMDRLALDRISTTKGGSRYATTVGGQIAGFGANFIIIDDALNSIDAGSDLVRKRVNEWFGFSVFNRQNQKNASIIHIAQRLHEEDLAGFLIKKGEWSLLRLPAVAEEDEEIRCKNVVFRRRQGELLSPKRLDEQFYADQRKNIGEYGWAGQFQQRPVPMGGGELKREWVQFYDGFVKYEEHSVYICVDPAGEKKDSGDYTAMFVIGLGRDKNIYVHDIVRDRLPLQERTAVLFNLYQKYNPKRIIYEKYGKDSDIEHIRAMQQFYNLRFTVFPASGKLAKEDRIRRLIPYFESNRIWFPRTLRKTDSSGIIHDLVHDFIEEEMLTFPVGAHDDMLDCLSRIFDAFNGGALVFPTGEEAIDFTKFMKVVR